ncbi:MAG: RICIN domain-containing protein [Bryobacteraceae bacterium]
MKAIFTWFVGTALCASTLGAANINVPAGGDLQAALNSVQGGDTVTLAAGATYSGHFQLKPNNSSQWITIQSSGVASLPAGTRVTSNSASAMAKLVTPDGGAALQISNGANFYRIVGLEFAPAAGVYAQDVIQVGLGSEASTSQLPHDIDFDRVYVHGDPRAGSKRGIAMNGINTTVENSYMAAFTSTWQDTQAIAGWNGPGPYKIVNNYLEAGTETVAFGGAVPAISGLVPSDILVQNNSFFKPLSWRPGSPSYAGTPIWVKNHLELKTAQRVTIDNNVFENNWVGGDQRGFALVFSVRTELGQVPWSVVNDIQVTNNIFRHSAAGIVITGHDDNPAGSGTGSNFTIKNNVFQDITGDWGGDGRLFQITGGAQNITIDHNTAFQAGFLMVFDNGTSYNVNYTNNISNVGWGVVGNGSAEGTSTQYAYMGGGQLSGNVLIGGNGNRYSASNYFPSSVGQVGFLDFNGGNFTVSASSQYAGLGAGSGGSTPTPVSGPPTPQVPSGWVNIVSKNSGKCLDVVGISMNAGAGVQQWSCWGGDNQKFMFTPVSGGFKVIAKHSGMGLDVAGGPSATFDGAALSQWPFWGGSNEIFQANPTSDGYLTINPVHSGKCLDVSGISKNDGAQVFQWSCWGGDNQKWTLVPVQ